MALLGALAFYFNRLVRLRNRVDNAWHQIDVQLARRYYLVPRLAGIVEGYAAHESETLESAARALDRAGKAVRVGDRALAENILTDALSSLTMLAERYPNLKADREFGRFQKELSVTEGRIAGARKYYNGTVMQYDNGRQSFPANLVARLLSRSFSDREYFEMEEPS